MQRMDWKGDCIWMKSCCKKEALKIKERLVEIGWNDYDTQFGTYIFALHLSKWKKFWKERLG